MPKNSAFITQEKGFAHILVLVISVITLAGSVAAATTTTTKEFTAPFVLPSVLGEDEEAKKAEEQALEAAKRLQEQQKEAQKNQKENQKKQEEQQREHSKSSGYGKTNSTKTETISPTGIKSKTQTEGKKSETEIETSDGQKIKTKVEDDGTAKVEVEHGQLKIKYNVEDGQIKLKAENGQGQEVKLKDDELNEIETEIENDLKKDGVKIATSSGKPVLTRNNIAALTDFPLSINVGTKQLIITTPAGQKTVTVLPDQAVQNLLSTGIINRIDQSADSDLTDKFGQLNGTIKLEIRNNEAVYKIKGIKTQNLLGFIPIDTSTIAFVSAESGQPVAQEQSFLANVIDLLSL